MPDATPNQTPDLTPDAVPAKLDLRGLELPALSSLVAELGERPFRARQLFGALHRRQALTFDELTDQPKALREQLAARTRLAPVDIDLAQASTDGTLKYRLKTADGKFLEAVFMPEGARRTLCVSSQVGCAMGCNFCRTATMGLIRNLTVGEILGQVYRVERDLKARLARGELTLETGSPDETPASADAPPEAEPKAGRVLTNLVFMGMGEPLHNLEALLPALRLLLSEDGMNLSQRHITVSTSGLVPEIGRFGREAQVKLAVSLNGTTDEQRTRLMPVNKKYPLAKLLAACRAFPGKIGRRITFEYVLLEGENDSPEDVERLARLAKSVPAKVNLIAYNTNPGLGFHSPPETEVQAFRAALERRGVEVFIRKNRGRDISAACGQLAVEGMGQRRLPVLGGSAPSPTAA